jgi:hypothetical protein
VSDRLQVVLQVDHIRDGVMHSLSYSEDLDNFDLLSEEGQKHVLWVELKNLRWEMDQKLRPAEFDVEDWDL